MRRFITKASCLLTLIGVVATHNSYAQSGPATASTNQKNETSKPQRDEPETETVSDAQLISIPFKQSRWFTRVGFMVAPYHSSTTIATNGQALSGGTAEASNNMSVTFDLGYEITKKHFGVGDVWHSGQAACHG